MRRHLQSILCGMLGAALWGALVNPAPVGASVSQILARLQDIPERRSTGQLALPAAPPASGTKAALRFGSALSSGSSGGTYLGINAAGGFTGSFIDFQRGGTREAQLTTLGQWQVATSSAATPNYSYTTDTDTGTFSPGANQWAVSTKGLQRAVVDDFGNWTFTAEGGVTPFALRSGGAATPAAITVGRTSDDLVLGVAGSIDQYLTGVAQGDAVVRGTSAGLHLASNPSAIGLTVTAQNSVAIGANALATTATDGFLYIPSCSGPPTGTPTTLAGRNPIVLDSANNKLYIYQSGWRWVATN